MENRCCSNCILKGDERRPICGNCTKSNRQCRPPTQKGVTFRNYQAPQEGRYRRSASSGARRDKETQTSRILVSPETSSGRATELTPVGPGSDSSHGQTNPTSTYESTPVTTVMLAPLSPTLTAGSPTSTCAAPISPLAASGASISISQLLQSDPESPPFQNVDEWAAFATGSRSPPISRILSTHEALFVHHYACHLGRWLDCTDASRQFSLKIPALVTTSPILLEAVISFAARHLGDTDAANAAHDRCIAMIIVLLGSDSVCNDDLLLCAIVILRVFEQLTGSC